MDATFGAYQLPDFQGEITCTEVALTIQETQLGRGGCYFVKLENPDADEEGASNSLDILWGNKSVQRHRLVSGQSTEWFPVSSLDQLWGRVKGSKVSSPGTVRLIVSYLR